MVALTTMMLSGFSSPEALVLRFVHASSPHGKCREYCFCKRVVDFALLPSGDSPYAIAGSSWENAEKIRRILARGLSFYIIE